MNRATFIKDFATLGLELEDRVRLVEEIRSGLGLILVTSPAYNGAGTTAYSIMSFLAQGQRDVLSIEAPVQWTMDGVRQVEAETGPQGPKIEETLRAMVALRPDVLMLSAVPDYGTAVVAAQLASSLLVVGQATAASAAARPRGRAGARRAAPAPGELARARPGPAPRADDLPDLPGAGGAAVRPDARRPRHRPGRGAGAVLLPGEGLPDLQHDRLSRPPGGLRGAPREPRGALRARARPDRRRRSRRRRSRAA